MNERQHIVVHLSFIDYVAFLMVFIVVGFSIINVGKVLEEIKDRLPQQLPQQSIK
jgi:hypothetical protein